MIKHCYIKGCKKLAIHTFKGHDYCNPDYHRVKKGQLIKEIQNLNKNCSFDKCKELGIGAINGNFFCTEHFIELKKEKKALNEKMKYGKLN